MESDPTIEVITVVIDSFGGQAYSMFAMRDLIKTSKKPVSTVALGKAMSCGAWLLAAGTKGLRYISPSTHVMIHQISSGAAGKLEDMKVDLNHSTDLSVQAFNLLASDIGMPVNKLKALVKGETNSDLYLTPKECLKMKIVDFIDIPRMAFIPPMQTLTTNVKRR
jgi:ATP-dependent Clp protease protease subunit